MTQSPVAYVVSLTWVMNTFSQSQSKRAAAIALINSMASSGVIVSSSVYSDLVPDTATDAMTGTFGHPVGGLHT
jgi:hypothetical protein